MDRSRLHDVGRIAAAIFLAAATGIAYGGEAPAAGAAKTPYLEIPVIGRIGAQVRPEEIEKALAYAEGHAVQHVVFYVDSQGGDALAARSIHLILEKHDKTLTYTAMVRDAVGVAMVIPVWCRSIFVLPGASMGGVHLNLDPARFGPGMTAGIILANVALNAGVVAERHGHPPELIRAMVDPAETVAVWRDESGTWQYAQSLPPEVAKPDVALEDGPRSTLTLSAEQAVSLGLARPFDGPVDRLGRELGLPGWASAGDAGKDAMAGVEPPNMTKALAKAKHPQWLLDQNVRLREATKEAIENYMNRANQWDPKLGTYSTIKEGNWWGSWQHDTGRLTSKARTEWRERTDTTIVALLHARQGIQEMIELDRQAKTLDIEPTYDDGKLQAYLKDVEAKIDLLQKHREQRYVSGTKR
jgi:hypothetical protein